MLRTDDVVTGDELASVAELLLDCDELLDCTLDAVLSAEDAVEVGVEELPDPDDDTEL